MARTYKRLKPTKKCNHNPFVKGSTLQYETTYCNNCYANDISVYCDECDNELERTHTGDNKLNGKSVYE